MRYHMNFLHSIWIFMHALYITDDSWTIKTITKLEHTFIYFGFLRLYILQNLLAK